MAARGLLLVLGRLLLLRVQLPDGVVQSRRESQPGDVGYEEQSSGLVHSVEQNAAGGRGGRECDYVNKALVDEVD